MLSTLTVEETTRARRRGANLIVSHGSDVVSRLAPLADHPQWYVQRNVAEVLGQLAAPEGVPLLQGLLRSRDPRVLRESVVALAGIRDAAAGRAIHTVLRAATGEARQAVVDALVEAHDPRVVPVLVRILGESKPLGRDHPIVLETLDALGRIGDERAVTPVAAVMRDRRWFARRRTRALKLAAVGTLVRIGTPPAIAALSQAATTGDRMLRRIVRLAGLA
jgi:HEAT repeat protein